METQVVKYDKKLSMPVRDAGSMRSLLESNQQRLLELIPSTSGVSLEMIFSGALEAGMDNPRLYSCTGMSIIRSVKKAAELGLSLSKTLGMAYLVPYKTDCTLQIGYKGWEDLVYRATTVDMLDAQVVYRGDEIKIYGGTSPRIEHVMNPTASHADEEVIGVYAVAHFGQLQRFEWVPIEEIRKIRAESKSPNSVSWVKWFGEMCKAKATIRLCKHLPKSREAKLMELALSHEYEQSGSMHLIEGGEERKERFERLKASIEESPELPISHPDAKPPEEPEG